jgi:hypothetical protein
MPRQHHVGTPEPLRNRFGERLSTKAQKVEELKTAMEEAKVAVREMPTVQEDGTIPLATVGAEQRRLRPVEVPLTLEEAGATPEVAQALNARVATNEMPSRVHPSAERIDAMNKFVWRYWVEEQRTWTATSSATCNYVDVDVWGQWTRTSATTTYARAWAKWTDDIDTYRHARPVRVRHVPPPPPTPEELARQQALRDAEEAARKARVAVIEFAKEKSHKLLLSILDPKQQEELKTKGHFHCKSKKGVLYRIYTGTHGNVKRLDDRGKEIESLCIQPDNVPVYDAMLAQKLHIELNEDEFRKTANITRLYN